MHTGRILSHVNNYLNSNHTKQMHNYNPSCIELLKKHFGKFTSCRTFGVHKLVHSEPFLGSTP